MNQLNNTIGDEIEIQSRYVLGHLQAQSRAISAPIDTGAALELIKT